MTRIQFYKYQGAGNDFILIDNRVKPWNPSVEEVARLCDRRFGIGADGLMLLGEKAGYDFGMTYYNSDGKESTMCGNGGRCITAFARYLGLVDTAAFFSAIDGDHEAVFVESPAPVYRLKMRDTQIEQIFDDGYYINTGSPHFVMFSEGVECMDVFREGRKLRNDSRFSPGGTNVDFVEIRKDGLFVRTYERGVEDETLSCGTGVTASVLVAACMNPAIRDSCSVKTPGGTLKVSFKQTGKLFSEVWLEGPAEKVFAGEMEVK